MRILITNDDSISAPVLLPLARWARKLGEVEVFAPKIEQSGKSHGIELRHAFEAKKVEFGDFEAWAVDSTPADCVRFAVLGLGRQYDLVISGINKGYNMGVDIMYSGTVGAIYEAGNLGIPAVALSTDPKDFTSALEQLDLALDFFRQHRLLEKHSLYNVNFPLECKGIRITRQGGPLYSDDFPHIGNDLYMPTGVYVYKNRGDLTLDTDATMAGYLTVTPMTLERTDMELYRRLAEWNP